MDNAMLHRWGGPETILVATNLLDAPHIGPHARAQARLSGAKVLLVHVIQPSYLRTNPTEGLPFVLPSPTLRSVQSRLNEIAKEFQYEGVLCEPIVLKGLPGEQIPALIHERRVDRVIVGTRGAEALDRILLGSVANDLLHQVDVRARRRPSCATTSVSESEADINSSLPRPFAPNSPKCPLGRGACDASSSA